MIKLNKFVLYLSIFAILLQTGCTMNNRPQDSSVMSMPSAPYYSVEEKSIDAEPASDLCFLQSGFLVENRNYSKDYNEAYQRFYGDQLYLSQGGPSDENGKPIYPEDTLSIYTLDGAAVSSLNLNEILGATVDTRHYSADTDGGFYVLSSFTDFISATVSTKLTHFRPDGIKENTVTIYPDEYMCAINSFEVSSDGHVFVLAWTDQSGACLFEFSKDGMLFHKEVFPETVTVSMFQKDNKIYILLTDNDPSVLSRTLSQVNIETGQVQPIQVAATFPADGDIASVDGSILSWSSNRLTKISLDKENSDVILTWDQIHTSVNPICFLLTGDQSLYCLGTSCMTGDLTLAKLTQTNTDTYLSRKPFVVAGFDLTNDSSVKYLAYQFESIHPEYRVIIRDYSEEMDMTDITWDEISKRLREIMLLDLASGNAPDVYLDINNNMSLYEFADESFLCNIAPDLNELSDTEYYKNVLSPSDGAEYFAPAFFTVEALYGKASILPRTTSWTFDEFDTWVNQQSPDASVFSGISKSSILSYLLRLSVSDFVNLNQATENFQSDEFGKMLEWADKYGDTETVDGVNQGIMSGQILLNYAYIDNLDSVVFSGEQLREVGYIGFPSETGSGIMYYPRYVIAISAQSQSPDLGKDFLSLALSDDFQLAYASSTGNPVSRTVAQSLQAADAERLLEYSDTLTQENMDKYISVYDDLLNKAAIPYTGCESIERIVQEEAAAYFTGQKSISEVQEVLSNRIRIYIHERYD